MEGKRSVRCVIVGAGMAGIAAAIKLREAGIDDLVLYEKADRIGGTWRENTYPGIACDVPSHLYCYSFEPNTDWSHTYSPGEEIQQYLEGVVERNGIGDLIHFGEEVESLVFEDSGWQIRLKSGRQDRADFVIAATGVLHHPNIPHFEGIETFAGATFHSSRWDHDVALDGQRVGVIGTGSTAVQITVALIERVATLSLFQRTAQWIVPAENRRYRDDELSAFRANPEYVREHRSKLAHYFEEGFANAVADVNSPQIQRIVQLCHDNLETVADPDLRERLRPDYVPACKRLVMSGGFYEAIQQPNAELVTRAIERVEPDGVRTADGVLHELDVLVLATGFRVDRFTRPMTVLGRDGASLEDLWEQRPIAYLSVSVPGFPNLFMLNGPNGPVGNFSLIDVAELQTAYILGLIDEVRAGHCDEISATHEATTRHEDDRVEAAKSTVWSTGCRSWYLDDRGIPAVWPWTFDRFRAEMAAPEFDDYEMVSASPGLSPARPSVDL